ncbi:MAG TPA: TlpA disulfide reductase family protein [Acidobacteriaceae bacterium]|nr:TlpA disulfide reductase family protein [Acidobacteriaceae bacterium]
MPPRSIFRFAALIAMLALAATGCNSGGYPADINRPAPNFTIHYDGQTVSLNQYRGKIVVLNFWASWCTYCALEWPSLEQLQNQFPNLVVLAVAFDSDPSDYKQYVVDNQLHNMTVILDPRDKSNLAFGTTRPPETYIIDPNGIIRRRFIGAQDWNTPEIQTYIRNLERQVPAKQAT